jgi:hypothetical protein
MNTRSRWVLLALGLAAMLAFMPNGDARSGNAQASKRFQLPDTAFDGLIHEANKNLQEELASPEPWVNRVRSNALMIALATQHRLAHKRGDARQLNQFATMRDAVLRLARAIDLDGVYRDLVEVRKQADLLNTFPDIKANPNATREVIRLKGAFEQEDVDFHFAKKRTQLGIEREMWPILRATKPMPIEKSADKLEMIGYKVALLAEMLRDFDDNVREQKVNQRKEWVAHATDAQYMGWQLAEAARAKDAKQVKSVVERMTNACNECHAKFRCD